MTDQPIDFNEVMQEPAPSKEPENELAKKLDGFAEAVGTKFNDVDSNIVVLDNRLGNVELFMAFLLKENPKIVEQMKKHAEAAQAELRKDDGQKGPEAT